MTRKHLSQFILVGFLWGVPYLFMRVAVREWEPSIVVFEQSECSFFQFQSLKLKMSKMCIKFQKKQQGESEKFEKKEVIHKLFSPGPSNTIS